MTARLLRAAGLALLVMAGAASATPAQKDPDMPGDPVKLVRTLQFLQDTIVDGTIDSSNARGNLIAFIGQRFRDLDPATWEIRENADAALLYVLNGGDPAVLHLLRPADDDEARRHLIGAVAAYAAGAKVARELWDGIDLRSLPLALIGPAALVKANLFMDSAPEEAMRYVDIARLESPGTLVEEAATRRGIEIAAKLGQTERFEFYAERYATRFPRSMYGEAFLHRFAESYLHIAQKPDGEPRLDDILAPLGVPVRQRAYVEVARLGVLEARLQLAQRTAEKALKLSDDDTTETQRADLYRTAALALSGELPKAPQRLASLAVSKLGREDRRLLQAVRRVVDEIERWPSGDAAPSEVPAGDAGADFDVISKQTRAVIAAASQVLEGAE